MGHQCIKDRLTLENLLELDPSKDQLEMGHRQILLDPKTKAWVEEQSKINTEKTVGYDKSYEEARNIMHPDPHIGTEPPVKSQQKDTLITLEKEKDAPQPSRALQEFVNHITERLVGNGWNLHLKFGKGEPQGNSLFKALPHRSPQLKLTKKEKLVNHK